jgi:c-di-AMP phosphodiesterase-like protein
VTDIDTEETDALTVRFNQLKSIESPNLVSGIEMDAKVIRLGLMNRTFDEGTKSGPHLRVVGGREMKNQK